MYPLLSDRSNIVVIADEAHCSQYGFAAKEIDVKDEQGNVGKRTAYGFAKYVRDVSPNATFLGFTEPLIESTDVNTPAIFAITLMCDIAQAVEDGATVKIYYELPCQSQVDDEGRRIDRTTWTDLEEEELSVTQKAKAK